MESKIDTREAKEGANETHEVKARQEIVAVK